MALGSRSELRLGKVQLLANASSGAVIELPLPSVEGQIIIPRWITFSGQRHDTGEDIAMGLSYYLNEAVPTSTADLLGRPNVWLFHTFDAPTQHWDLGGEEVFLLGGSQAFLYFNGVAAGLQATCMMYYHTATIPLIEWAAITRSTSFED